jgi:cytochrome c
MMRLAVGVLVWTAIWGAGLTSAYAQSPQPTIPDAAADPALRGHGGPVRALAVLPDGRLASGGFDSTIIVWDLALGQAVHVLRQHETAVNVLAAHQEGCLLSGGEDAKIKIWCDKAEPTTVTLTGHTGAVSALATGYGSGQNSGAASKVVSGGWDRTVRVWRVPQLTMSSIAEPQQPESSLIIAEHPSAVTSVLLSDFTSSSVVSASQDGMIRKTPVEGGPPLGVLQLPVGVNSMAWTKSGTILLACGDGSLREADAELKGARIVAQLEGPLTAIRASADGKTAVTGGLRTPVTLIDLTPAAAKPVALGNALPFWAMIYSRDGREILTGGNDRAVRRFDAVTGSPVAPTIPKPAPAAIADAKDRGAKVFRACAVCHGLTAADTHLAGPTLHQIMGRKIASLRGYEYSGPLRKLDITWTPETIAKLFEVGPAIFTPGTKMPEQRVTDAEDRQALVEWLGRVTVP